jgi:hypothetical protein
LAFSLLQEYQIVADAFSSCRLLYHITPNTIS